MFHPAKTIDPSPLLDTAPCQIQHGVASGPGATIRRRSSVTLTSSKDCINKALEAAKHFLQHKHIRHAMLYDVIKIGLASMGRPLRYLWGELCLLVLYL